MLLAEYIAGEGSSWKISRTSIQALSCSRMKVRRGMKMNRRDFLKTTSIVAAAMITRPIAVFADETKQFSGIKWFRDAKFGLFVHYGLYSLLGLGEWVQYLKRIHVKQYEKLKKRFTAKKFDADFITDLACEAEMKYVNITTMHHDGFCLFDTKETNFNSLQSPAKRDLTRELVEQCNKKGLGICFYYSHGRNWKHPHAMMNGKYGNKARPQYKTSDPTYATDSNHNIKKYVEYCQAQIRELLSNYGLVTNIWFDGSSTTIAGPWKEELHIPELYKMIRQVQPKCLISYKWGVTGMEDFYAPEYDDLQKNPVRLDEALQSGKPIELCHSIAGWGYKRKKNGKHRGAKSVMKNLEYAASLDANLLLNIAPRPDGSIDQQDIKTLHEVGKRLRNLR